MKKKFYTRVHQSDKVRVVDATKPLNFYVGDDDIYKGKRHQKENCVLACALREKIPSAITVEVGTAITKVRYSRKIVRYSTPSTLAKQLRKWDTTGRWQLPPGWYKLNPVALMARLGARGKKGRGPHSTVTHKRKIPGTHLTTSHPTRWIVV